jgi:hypothetical protein
MDVAPHIAVARDLVELALEGARANDRPDLIDRLAGVERDLCAANDRAGAPSPVSQRAAEQVLRAVNSLETDLRSRHAMLSDPARTARLSAELEHARARAEKFAASAREWRNVLGDGFAAISSDVEFHVRTRFGAVIADAERGITGGDPVRGRDVLDSWLRQRLIEEATSTYRVLSTGAERVAGELASQLDLGRPHSIPTLPVVAPQQLVADLSDREPTASGEAPVPARLLTVLMPSYGGLMMALVISRVLGLQLPIWLIAALAIAGALTLGGAAFSGERRRQLDRRRSEAMNMVRATVDEFQLALLKQVRDASRTLQKDLRDATAATVEKTGTTLREELDALETAATSARRRATEVSNISDDLSVLADLRRRAQELLSSTTP